MNRFTGVERVAAGALPDGELKIFQRSDLRAGDADRPGVVAAHDCDPRGGDPDELGAHGTQPRLRCVSDLAGERDRQSRHTLGVQRTSRRDPNRSSDIHAFHWMSERHGLDRVVNDDEWSVRAAEGTVALSDLQLAVRVWQ